MRTRIVPFLAIAVALPLGLVAQDRVEELILEKELAVRPGGELTVNLGDMDIDIRSGSGNTASVRVFASGRDMSWAREVFQRMRFEAVGNGGDLRIETRDERIEGNEWRRRGWVSHRAEVTIPDRYDLDLRTGDGDIRITDIDGALVARTGDGDIDMGRIAGPRIELRTGDGDVTAEALAANEILIDTGDGDLSLRRVSGRITAESGDGDISLDIVEFAGVSVRTGDGDVSLAVDPNISADLEIEGEDVDLGFALTVSGRVRERRVSGSVNGGGPPLTVRTGDGSVTIRARS